jgi:protein-S-isoprenylcysteine O-methyltransferase Ste14
MERIVMSPKPKRSIPLSDVIFGSFISPLIFIGIFYALDAWLVHSSTLIPYPVNLSGFVFIILGVALASWCFRTVYSLPKDPVLVTWGPWSWNRHPIYVAAMLFNLGVALIIGTAVLSLEIVFYTLIDPLFNVPREEKKLRKIFAGEYEEYSNRVPRWIPRSKR